MIRDYTGSDRRFRQRRQIEDRRSKARFEATITQRRSGMERRGTGGTRNPYEALYGH